MRCIECENRGEMRAKDKAFNSYVRAQTRQTSDIAALQHAPCMHMIRSFAPAIVCCPQCEQDSDGRKCKDRKNNRRKKRRYICLELEVNRRFLDLDSRTDVWLPPPKEQQVLPCINSGCGGIGYAHSRLRTAVKVLTKKGPLNPF